MAFISNVTYQLYVIWLYIFILMQSMLIKVLVIIHILLSYF